MWLDSASGTLAENCNSWLAAGLAPARSSLADKEPVFLADGGGTDGIFDQVIVDFQAAVFQPGLQVGPLVQGVVQSLAQGTLRQVAPAGFEKLDGPPANSMVNLYCRPLPGPSLPTTAPDWTATPAGSMARPPGPGAV